MTHPDQSQDAAVPLAGPEIVTLPVEADITNSEVIGEALRAAFRPGVLVVIADLSATEFLDSSAIRHLILANNHATSSGAQLRVVITSLAVRRVLEVLEADQILRLYPDMAAALTGAPPPRERPEASDVGRQLIQLPATDSGASKVGDGV